MSGNSLTWMEMCLAASVGVPSAAQASLFLGGPGEKLAWTWGSEVAQNRVGRSGASNSAEGEGRQFQSSVLTSLFLSPLK